MKKILNLVLKPSVIVKINNLKNRVMWGAYESTLKDVGNNCKVQWPFQIHGACYISIGDNFDAGKIFNIIGV